MEKTKINVNTKNEIVSINLSVSVNDLNYLQMAVEARQCNVTNAKLYSNYTRLLDELNVIISVVNDSTDCGLYRRCGN
jgi:hypothetical protein